MTSRQLAIAAALACFVTSCGPSAPSSQFEITFPKALHAGPITGRVYLILSPEPNSNALRQRSLGHQPVTNARGVPFFAVDVDRLEPGQAAVIDAATLGYPIERLRDLLAGDYYAQALFNVYTEFHRADGHSIWAHMDQWEGQHFNWAPGNLFSNERLVSLDPDAGYAVKIEVTEKLPPIELPEDDPWVQRVKFESRLLTEFLGRPIFIGATVLLPRGYDTHPRRLLPDRLPARALQSQSRVRFPNRAGRRVAGSQGGAARARGRERIRVLSVVAERRLPADDRGHFPTSYTLFR